MQTKTIPEINEIYNLELNKIIKNIKKQKHNKVLLQFPEGIKPYSTTIAKEIENQTNCQCFIWLDTCFGACDIPLEVEKLGIDLIIQFGHNQYGFKKQSLQTSQQNPKRKN